MPNELNNKPKVDLGLDLFSEKSGKSTALNDDCRLEINITFSSEDFQEVEIICGGKRRKRKLTKLLPPYFASNFEDLKKSASNENKPSGNVGATNLGNLSQGSNMVLKEKFLRILAKINHVSEIKTAEKIWDSNERIPTSDKAILLAVFNSVSPQKLDRSIISQRSYEIEDKAAFAKFINTTIELTRDSKKLGQFLFGGMMEKIGEEKQSFLTGCLRNILSENDERKCAHQIKFLEKILGEVSKNNEIQF